MDLRYSVSALVTVAMPHDLLASTQNSSPPPSLANGEPSSPASRLMRRYRAFAVYSGCSFISLATYGAMACRTVGVTPRGVRFGELTFTPAAALDNKRLPETDLRFGRRMEETL